MKIEQIDLYLASMPLIRPFRTAFGTADSVESIFIRMTSDGVVGWGEATPGVGPFYSPEWGAGAFQLARDWLAPRLVGAQFPTGQAVQERLAHVKDNFFAKAALDAAWWDLAARMADKPVWQMIGGVTDIVEVGEDIGLTDTVEELIDETAAALAAGSKRIKVKVIPGWDVKPIGALRRRFPDAVVHIDCNGAYSNTDRSVFEALDAFDLAMIEQPLARDDIVDHAALQATLSTGLCLDESIVSVARARKAIDLAACRWINIKCGRVGGLTPAIAIHEYCASRNIPCWAGFMIESALGQAQTLAMATLPNMKYPADAFPSRRFHAQDLCEPEIEFCGTSVISAGLEPGFGRTPNTELLARQTRAKATVRATG